jgi:uncharacterized protein YhaN
MRISEFSVAEFGALRGVSGTLAPRLSVVWGGNESGKTTLARFFRRALFVDKTHGDEALYQGAGALLLHMNDGQNLKVTLSGRKNLLGDSSDSMTAMQEDFLPFDAETYERVFSIGSVSPDMRDAVQVTGMNAWSGFFASEAKLELGAFPRFAAGLDELERGIYSFSDDAGALNRLWAEINSNNLEIENLENWKAAYWELRETLEEKQSALKNTRDELEKNLLSLARAELIAKARPAWLEVRDLEKELASLAPREMPKRGLERMDSLRDRVADLRRRLDERRRKNAYEASRRRQMENNPIMTLLKYREPLESLEREMERLKEAEADKAGMAAEAADAEDALKRELLNFAPDWSEEDLAAADLSLVAERKANAMRDAMEDLKKRICRLRKDESEEESRLAALRAETASIRNEVKSAASASDPTLPNKISDYRARRETLSDIRRGLLRYDALCWEIRGGKMCASVIENEIKAEGSPPPPKGSYMAKLLLALLLSLSGISVAVGLVAPVFRPYDVYALMFFVLTAIGPAFSLFMAGKEHSVRLAQWKARYERRDRELDVIDHKIVEQRREMQAIADSIEQESQALGIRTPTTLFDLDDAARLLEDERYGAERLELRKDEGERLLKNLADCETRLIRLKDKLSGLKRELDDALASWKNWLLLNKFDADLTPECFGSFLASARAARSDLKLLDGIRNKMARHGDYEESIEARIREFCSTTGLELDKEGLPTVFRSLKEALSLRARLDASLEEKRAIDFECSELERELAAAVGSVRALCEEAGADNEESFRAMFEERENSVALGKRLSEARRALAGILAFADCDAALRDQEFLADALALAENTEALKLAAADGEKALRELTEEVQELSKRTDSVESDDRLFALRQRNESLKALAQKEFRRWLAVVLLKRFAGKAMERREKSLEPEILRRARQFLSLMAASNWKIVLDEERGGGSNEEHDHCAALEREADGIRLDEAQWSLGLAEQVGLSIRLAMACRLAERLGERSEPVPLMLDDVLTRFDEGRQRGAIEALWRVSEKLQVIFFTCHRSTMEMFRSRLANEKGFSAVEISGSTFFKGRAKRSGKKHR